MLKRRGAIGSRRSRLGFGRQLRRGGRAVGFSRRCSRSADQIGDELLGLAAAGAVADGDDGDLVLADELFELRLASAAFCFWLRVDHRVFEQLAGLVEHRDLAAGAEAGVDGQHLLAADRRLEQQAAQVAGEDVDGVLLGALGQFAADLALQAGQERAGRARPSMTSDQNSRCGWSASGEMVLRDLVGQCRHPSRCDLQDVRLLAAVDRQHAVRRDVLDRLLEVEVGSNSLPFPSGTLVLHRGDQPGVPEKRRSGPRTSAAVG